ncbi:MAG: Eco57I restriction-modification methylase domain-containing protein, partial [Campylobacterales bacterium]|nr:Eco57I restriction-modification methylase domain-containing protein [Campylobacterales bacterium]
VKQIFKDYNDPNKIGDKTIDFYNSLQKYLNQTDLNKTIDCAHFNIEDFTALTNQRELISLAKLLSADTLYKEFNPNDANSLNKEFYTELLYILGLEEVKDGGKKLIKQATKPQHGSFYENIANKLAQYGKPTDFETIIKLIIIWINRILFLKLLESQLIKWNANPSLKFLDITKINDYDKLEMLFFEILAKRPSERIHEEFDYIPYLNSSLFEIRENETKYLTISNLSDDAKINYYQKTVIKDEYGKKKLGQVSTLAYLFEFLDSYDFGSTTTEEIVNVQKSLINASVLGLIFEKINGYKDGSFYTPSFITMYMARESIQKTVIEKLNRTFEIEASSFDELVNYCNKHNYKNDFIIKASCAINSITICDPAVGSGHFLVSALNELIYIKYQLGLFSIRGLHMSLANDELHIKLENEWFEYKKPQDFDSLNHKLQKLLFEEKQKIIENQLFGVDINPNSSQITKLRLWIELLKNSYYDENYQLVTLPNIDINIKTGNSLISRFELQNELKINNITEEIKNYKQRVNDYKNNLGTKKEVLESIASLKDKFKLSLKAEAKIQKEFDEKLKNYYREFGFDGLDDTLVLKCLEWKNQQFQPALFGDKDTKKQAKLLGEITKLQSQIDEIEQGKIYEDAFEWRFEFPEVLDDEGNFKGFDIVIGNPPYIMEDDNKFAFDGLREKPCYQGKTDIWHIFGCLGLNILKTNGLMSYIAKNQWLESQSASNMRKTIYENGNILSIIDFGTNMVFEEASQQTMIFLIKKDIFNQTHNIKYKKVINNISNDKISKLLYETEDENLKTTLKEIPKFYDEKANLTFSNSKNEETLSKIESLKNFEFDEKKEMIQGLIGGPDEAFIVSEEKLNNFNDDEKMEFFLKNIVVDEWNAEQDRGRSLREGTEIQVTQHPYWEKEIRAYYDNWSTMLRSDIPQNVNVLRKLEHSPYELFGLTNWSAETFPYALENYPFFEIFKGKIVVSGT